MDLSIVTTMYFSAPYVKEFYTRICATAEKITNDYEIILVNDGSPDDSLDIAVALYKKDPKVKVIDLSRNFGHHKAMMTGLMHAGGELVSLIDCDLEEEPELLERFYAEHKNNDDVDVVYGVQKARKGGFVEKISGNIFFWMFNLFSSYPVPANLVTARLMSKRYVDSLVKHKDREVFMAGLWAITGFKQVPLMVTKHDKGNSSYDLRKKISILVNSITSFSNKPLLLIFYLGSMILSISSLAALYLIIRRVFFGVLLAGWASLMVTIWLLGGLTIFCVGVIGIYLSRVFMETKERPYTIIRQIYER
ncbi:MAG: glycosyltransferase, partial [Candidatus Aenigmarchaeota archaeon]|nr:glycosyltransferase [Candidatus Aenigmarchaeota archaeon]